MKDRSISSSSPTFSEPGTRDERVRDILDMMDTVGMGGGEGDVVSADRCVPCRMHVVEH